MILLDTDHVSVLQITEGQRTHRLKARLAAAGDPILGTTIITVEEQLRGWLAAIARERKPRRQVAAYRNLAELLDFFSQFYIAAWEDTAAEHLEQLPSECRRIGLMDRKIAAICLANDALLLTANAKDSAPFQGYDSPTGSIEAGFAPATF